MHPCRPPSVACRSTTCVQPDVGPLESVPAPTARRADATGFDVFTGSLLKPAIVGRDGLTLREKWAAGPTSFLGIGVAGFPDMFVIVGPGSPSLLGNVLLSSEEQIDWLTALFAHARGRVIPEIVATEDAERDWVAPANARAEETLYLRTPSYRLGARLHVLLGRRAGYRRILERTAASGYEGFALRRAWQAAVA